MEQLRDTYGKGVEYVLFLWTGPSGRTQVTGLSQGVFEVVRAEGAAARAVRRSGESSVFLPAADAGPEAESLDDLSLDELRARIARATARDGQR